MIVSASRRTDLPALYPRWLAKRVEEGFCTVANPFNPSQVRRVSLAPADLDALILWTRNPGPLLPEVEKWEASSLRTFWLVTLTGYPPVVEPSVPDRNEAISSIKRLSAIVGRERIFWRYDPVLLAPSAGMGIRYHEENFRGLADVLAPRVRRVIVSLYDDYRSAAKRLKAAGIGCESGQNADFGFLAKTAAGVGIEIRSCCEKMVESGIEAGGCIDGAVLDSLWDLGVSGKRDKGQREECLCAPSADIGAYSTCSHGCLYCYAGSFSENAARVFTEGPAAK